LELPPLKARVLRASVLGGEPVVVKQSDAGLSLVLPENQRDPIDTVVKLELDSSAENELIDGKPLDVSVPALGR
jgi:hypothetical protein